MLGHLSWYINMVVLLFIAVNTFLMVGGLIYLFRIKKTDQDTEPAEYPTVSVIVPAHNEALVIENTVKSLLAFDYPDELYELIVVNDNSSDDSADVLKRIQKENEHRKFKVITTNAENGGKGKSNALNIALEIAHGEVIAIYDADNTPNADSLRILVKNLMADERRAAVIGKIRIRNKFASLLARLINIESLSYQYIHQAGRYFYFKLCTIPGTNYVIRRSVIEEIGGWDVNALSEDTEVSFRIYRKGYYIAFMPLAITWEQEPQKLRTWFKQRTRWARGNIYVYLKNLRYIFVKGSAAVRLDILYNLSVYLFMFSAVLASDIIGLMSLFGIVTPEIGVLFPHLFGISIFIFILNILISLAAEPGECNIGNLLLIILMLFTYSKLWVVVVIYAIYLNIRDKIRRSDPVWYKTVRFSEKKEYSSAKNTH